MAKVAGREGAEGPASREGAWAQYVAFLPIFPRVKGKLAEIDNALGSPPLLGLGDGVGGKVALAIE